MSMFEPLYSGGNGGNGADCSTAALAAWSAKGVPDDLAMLTDNSLPSFDILKYITTLFEVSPLGGFQLRLIRFSIFLI